MREQIIDPWDLTPPRLTQILVERGALLSGAVSTVEQLPTIEASSARFTSLRLTYTLNSSTDAPTALFLKTFKPHVRMDYGANEVAFYTNLAPAVNRLPVVRCYDAYW